MLNCLSEVGKMLTLCFYQIVAPSRLVEISFFIVGFGKRCGVELVLLGAGKLLIRWRRLDSLVFQLIFCCETLFRDFW